MGLNHITIRKPDGKEYHYEQIRVGLKVGKDDDLIAELKAIPADEFDSEIISRIQAKSLTAQIRDILQEILGSEFVTLPKETHESAVSALQSLGGLF